VFQNQQTACFKRIARGVLFSSGRWRGALFGALGWDWHGHCKYRSLCPSKEDETCVCSLFAMPMWAACWRYFFLVVSCGAGATMDPDPQKREFALKTIATCMFFNEFLASFPRLVKLLP
jgi:hypothetical protein